MGKLIVIEGTDCSGKETQTKMLYQRLQAEGKSVAMFSFPNYDSPTGKIVGDNYLGKSGASYFKEGAINVNPYVASLYYAADRKYNIEALKQCLVNHDFVIVDRYVTSNMAHQCGKLKNSSERAKMYEFIKTLEYDLLELPKPDLVILLYMPYDYSLVLKEQRIKTAILDEHERSKEHLLLAEQAYLELASKEGFKKVEAVDNGKIKDIDIIHEEVYNIITKKM